MKRALSAFMAPVFAGAFILSACITPAAAQTTSATVVAACGTPPATYPAGANRALTQDTTGTLCTAAGGGGGGGAVYGPNAVGAAASHPPVIVGGTADATATGTVQVQKVDASGNAYTSATVSSSALPANAAQESGGNLAGINTNTATIAGAVGSSIPAGTNSIGTLNGATPYGSVSTASTNATNIKNAAGVVTSLNPVNTTTTIAYLRLYNLSSAPTCSSATGYVATIPVPPAAASGGAGGIAVNLGSGGLTFSTGISYCLTGGGSSTDNTNAPAGVYLIAGYR